MATTLPIGFPPAAHAGEAVDKITQNSGGRLEIKMFPNSQLGGATDILAQLRLGSVQLSLAPNSDAATIVPVMGMTTLPFLVTSHEQGVKLLAGPLGGYVHDAF